jgi:hypothetical protein
MPAKLRFIGAIDTELDLLAPILTATIESFVSDRVDRNQFNVPFEHTLEQPIKRTLISYHTHEVRMAIGAVAGDESRYRRNESRAQDSAHHYLESVGRQSQSFG